MQYVLRNEMKKIIVLLALCSKVLMPVSSVSKEKKELNTLHLTSV